MNNLQKQLIERRYLYGMCQMTGYMPDNEDLFYKLNWDNIKTLFQWVKDLWNEDKKLFKKSYKYITELEMFINWKGWLLRDYPQLEEWNNTVENFGKVWEKMHDYNCNKFDYGTEEGKYYFQTID